MSEDLFGAIVSDDGENAGPATESAGYFRPAHAGTPLAVRMRPSNLDEVLGQEHLLGAGTPLRRLIEGSDAASVILYGPPGTGKTTIAGLIANQEGRHFAALSALSSGVKEVRGVIELARRRLLVGEQTVLFIDEVHRFSKSQQDALLAAVENRVVLLVAATTENPNFSVVSPLLSRSLVLQLRALDEPAVGAVVDRALSDPRGYGGAIELADDARDHLVRLANGDARRALTILEAAADTVVPGATIDLEQIAASSDVAAVRYDRDGDQHYDVISAFIKSIRGSDPDAALHYLARMIVAGEDARFIARRLVIHASEDIGMADPTALTAATSALTAVEKIGMPEARLTLAQATIHLATAPKSNAVIAAIGAAIADVQAGKAGPVPAHLRDGHYAGAAKLGNAVGYSYPHDLPSGVARQQYPPDDLVGVDYYQPSERGFEATLRERLGRLRALVRNQAGGKR